MFENTLNYVETETKRLQVHRDLGLGPPAHDPHQRLCVRRSKRGRGQTHGQTVPGKDLGKGDTHDGADTEAHERLGCVLTRGAATVDGTQDAGRTTAQAG